MFGSFEFGGADHTASHWRGGPWVTGSYLLIMTGAPLSPEGFAAPLVLADRLAGWVEDAKIFPSLWPVIDWVMRPLT